MPRRVQRHWYYDHPDHDISTRRDDQCHDCRTNAKRKQLPTSNTQNHQPTRQLFGAAS